MSDIHAVSVVMLNYNGKHFLERTLPALRAQTYPIKEIIVVDNGSTDGSADFLRTQQDVRIVAFSKNAGKPVAMNAGIREATGELLLLLDEDALLHDSWTVDILVSTWRPKTILSPVAIDDRAEETKLYGGYLSLFRRQNNPAVALRTILEQWPKQFPAAFTNGLAIFMAKETWDQLGGYDEVQLFGLDDYDIGPRAWIFGNQISICASTYVTHLGVQDRASAAQWCWKYEYFFSGYVRMIIKNYLFMHVCIGLPSFFLYCVLKTMHQIVLHKSLLPLRAFALSCWRALRDIPRARKARKHIQSQRIVSIDSFFSIRSPQ